MAVVEEEGSPCTERPTYLGAPLDKRTNRLDGDRPTGRATGVNPGAPGCGEPEFGES